MAIVLGFHRLVQRKLQEAGLSFETEKAIGGVQPDLVVKAPNGRFFILELKSRTNLSEHDLRRASRQAKYICEAADADDHMVVVPDSARGHLPDGVFRVSTAVKRLQTTVLEKTSPRKSTPPFEKANAKPTIFAAMPFDEKYDDVFYLGIVPAAKAIGAKAERIDKEEFNGDIVVKIHAAMESSIAVVADISEAKPNVLFEAGYAHALPRPCIHICSTPLKKLPFDVDHWNTIEYKLGQVHILQKALAKRFRATLRGTAA